MSGEQHPDPAFDQRFEALRQDIFGGLDDLLDEVEFRFADAYGEDKKLDINLPDVSPVWQDIRRAYHAARRQWELKHGALDR